MIGHYTDTAGSSPRMRGALVVSIAVESIAGIIPADAGSTMVTPNMMIA